MKTVPTRRRSVAQTRGYTAIEVLMALTVFAVGAAGVISMQRASVQGNLDARRLDTANALAREWIERLRRDATLWTTPTPAVITSNFGNTQILSASGYLNAGGWVFPVAICPSSTSGANADGLCPAFDIFGRDLAQDHFGDAAFCVDIRLDSVAKDVTGTNDELIRGEVRVYWPRQLNNAPPASGGFCSAGALTDAAGPNVTTASQIYHFVHASTLLRRNPAQ